MKTLPIAELRGLLVAVADHGKQHLVEVDADLQQTTYLLNEAIEKLGSSFTKVHEAIAEQQAQFEKILSKYAIAPDELAQLKLVEEKIGSEVNAVVTSLQFQDLTSQLITRTIKRINGLKDLLGELNAHGNEMDPNHEHDEIAQFLETMSRNLNAGSHALSGGLRRSVGQQNMATGDIDLF